MNSDGTVQEQPTPNGFKKTDDLTDDNVSYVDSDTHAQAFCCCIHGWKSGPDQRWYFPWDKGIYRLLGIACMWYCLCAFVPCILCNGTARDIVCCEGQCTEGKKQGQSDNGTEEKDQIAEA